MALPLSQLGLTVAPTGERRQSSAAGMAKGTTKRRAIMLLRRGTIQCHRGYSGPWPIPGILVEPLAGVAELADAQDLGFRVTAVSNLLTNTQQPTVFIRRGTPHF